MVALTHPVFGVGPGCFTLVDQGWIAAHNTYTELAAEAGILALVLFLLAIRSAFKNIALVRKSPHYRDDPELRLFTQALWAGIVAYLVGACFASTEYNLYPYFMVAYTCAMVADHHPGASAAKGRREAIKTLNQQSMTISLDHNRSGVADEVLSVLQCSFLSRPP